MPTRDNIRLTLMDAKILLEGAEKKAMEIGVPMDIAVVDDGGNLLAFHRMEGLRSPASTSPSARPIPPRRPGRRPTNTENSPSRQGPSSGSSQAIRDGSVSYAVGSPF